MPTNSTVSRGSQSLVRTDDVKNRRERGKLAQRAFRQRQIDTIMSLRDETNKLKNAIITISQAATRDGTTLSQAIQSAQQLIATEESETNAIQPDSRAYHDDTSPVGIEYLPEDDGNDAELFRRITTVEHDEPQQNHSDTLGDFLSLHADRHITITSAPADIAPFLGAAAYSVAGQIHWVAMAYNYAAVKALRNADVSTEAYGQAARTFGPALRKISVDNLLGILQSRLVYRQNGVMTGVGHPARDPSLGKKLMMSLIKQSAPTPKKPYLTAFAVADRLRACLGSGFVDFEDILSSGSVDFRTPIMKATMKDLASKAICHGDGPRWDPDDVALIAQQWITQSTAWAQPHGYSLTF